MVNRAAEVQELNFGIIATENAGAMKQMWEPFLEDMGKAAGVKVNGFYATDYTGIIEAQRFNKIQIAWYGNKSAIDAVDRAGGKSSPSSSTWTAPPATTPTSSPTRTAASRASTRS